MLTALMNALQLFYTPGQKYAIYPSTKHRMEHILRDGYHYNDGSDNDGSVVKVAPRLQYDYVSRACVALAFIMSGYTYQFNRSRRNCFIFQGYQKKPTLRVCHVYCHSQGLQEGGFFTVARYFTYRCEPLMEFKIVMKCVGRLRQLAWRARLWCAMPLELQELITCHLGDTVPPEAPSSKKRKM